MVSKIKTELVVRLVSVALFVVITAMSITFSIYVLSQVRTLYMYVLAFSFFLLSAVSGFFNIFTSYSYYRSSLYDEHLRNIQKGLRPLKDLPTVAVAMPVYNEDTGTVEKNMLRLMEMNYPKEKIRYYLIDDSTDPKIRKELTDFSRKNKLAYIRRGNRKGFKAGALNNMTKHSKEEFLAIFDYDEYLVDNNFVMDLLPYFQDKGLAYVQTQKKFSKGTFFSDTVDIFHGFFFKFIQPSRALNNTAIFGGSCGLIKMAYLKKIGGFPEYVTEDTFFSFESDASGYKSLYVPKVYALGAPIKKFTDLAKQQWRYNYGDTQFLQYFFKRILGAGYEKKRSTLSTIDYVTHGFGLNYISVVLILFTIVSVLIVFSQLNLVTSFTITQVLSGRSPNIGFEVLGASAFILSLLTPIAITKVYFKSISKGMMMLLLNFSLAFIRTKAAMTAVFNFKKRDSWSIDTFANPRKKLFFALKNSATETVFSILLFVLGIIALIINNVYGGLWLMWYGGLYISTVFMFYRYK